MTAAELARQLEERELRARRPTNLWRDTLGEILRQRSALVGLAILGVILFAAVFAPLIAPYDPEVPIRGEGAERLTPPCIHLLGCPETQPQFIMGVDQNRRDEFSRVVYGARVSLQVGIVTVGMAIVVGTFIGSIAGYVGGWFDNGLMRIMDVLLAFPALVLAIFLATAFQTLSIPFLNDPLLNAMLAIGIVAIPVYARVMRASVLSVRERDFVTASRALGESGTGILAASHPPERADAPHRAGHARHRHRDPRGCRTLVPRHRRAGTDARVGVDDRSRAQPDVQRTAPRHLPGHRTGAQRPRLQPARRRRARRARPAAEPMTVVDVRAPRRRFGEAGDRLLDVRGLQTSFHTRDGVVRAVTGIDFHVDRGEVMGLVGESGCGKSVTSLSIMRLIAPPGRIEAGEVMFDGQDLLEAPRPRDAARSAASASAWSSSSRRAA